MRSVVAGLMFACLATNALAQPLQPPPPSGARPLAPVTSERSDPPFLETQGNVVLIRFPSAPTQGATANTALGGRGVCELFGYPATIAYGVDRANLLSWAMCRNRN